MPSTWALIVLVLGLTRLGSALSACDAVWKAASQVNGLGNFNDFCRLLTEESYGYSRFNNQTSNITILALSDTSWREFESCIPYHILHGAHASNTFPNSTLTPNRKILATFLDANVTGGQKLEVQQSHDGVVSFIAGDMQATPMLLVSSTICALQYQWHTHLMG